MQVIDMKDPIVYYVALAVFAILALSAGVLGHSI